LIARVAAETVRLVRRTPHARAALAEEGADRETFDLQMSRLSVLEPALIDYLDEVPPHLVRALPQARGQELRDLLFALNDLRAEAATEVMPLLERPGFTWAELAVEV